MTFAFDTGSAIDSLTTHNMLTDAVRDQLSPNHSEDEFRYAYAATIKTKFGEYRSTRGLVRFWFGQTNVLQALAEADPVLFEDLVFHLADRLGELT